MILPNHVRDQFQQKILSWYATHKRTWLPRRDSQNPYRVFVSEVMSQQTQVERVVPKFLAFIQALPDFQSLAQCERSVLLALRSWLGFNSRALRLQQSAQIICTDYEWAVPKTRSQLLALPWIWAYSSASILAFTYNIPAPVVDTNIRRVFIHELQWQWLDPEPSLESTQKQLEAIALAVTPEWLANDWNNALMDYGSAVATAKATWIESKSKQSKFEGSKRQVRWNITKRLIKYWESDVSSLQEKFPHPEFPSIVTGMLADWLISQNWWKLSV